LGSRIESWILNPQSSIQDGKTPPHARTRPATFTVDALNERGEMLPTPIAGEHPLTLYVDKREVVTLMTLARRRKRSPSATAQPAAGSIDHEIAAVQVDWETDSVAVTTRKGIRGLARKMGSAP